MLVNVINNNIDNNTINSFICAVKADGFIAKVQLKHPDTTKKAEKIDKPLLYIDFYAKTPYTNEMGRMWGSSRVMSPEEFVLGAAIDEITNVYTMGATAFALLSDSERSASRWPLSKELFDVVTKATSDDRSSRQQSIAELLKDWRNNR